MQSPTHGVHATVASLEIHRAKVCYFISLLNNFTYHYHVLVQSTFANVKQKSLYVVNLNHCHYKSAKN